MSFAKVFHQAEKTFSILNKDALAANLQVLKKLVDGLELSDLNINPYIVTKAAFAVRVSRKDF